MVAAFQNGPTVLRRPRIAIEDFLAKVPLFQAIDAREMARIAAGATEVDAPRATVLYRRGDPCHGLYITVFGQVKLALQTPQGGEKVIELIGPGECFGETAIFLDRAYQLTAETLDDTKLVHIAKATVLEELERTTVFTRSLITALSRRLQRLIGDLEGYTLHSGTQRVVAYLLGELPLDAGDGAAMLTFPTKKGIIASRLNLTQEHFSRILRELAESGLIKVDGRNVRVPDVGRLRSFDA